MTATAGTSARTYPVHSAPLWRRLLVSRDAAVLGLLAVVVVWAVATVPGFGGPLTLTFLLLDVTPILLIALPMTLVIVTGEIDLSVASTVGLTSVLVGVLHAGGLGIPAAAGVALLVGLACGLLNGVLVGYVGLPSLAVTIGTLALYRGLAVGLLGTRAVTDFPRTWRDLATAEVGGTGIPWVTVVVAVLAVGFGWLLQGSVFGRGVYDIGLNAEAARFSGVDVARTKLVLFAASGVVSALAGVYWTLRYGTARGDNATGLELQVVAAVLLGGVSIFGGRGRLPGVLAGVLLIGVVGSALRLQNVTVNVINVVVGLLLVASVVAPSVLARLSSRTGRRDRRPVGPAAVPDGAATTGREHP